MPYTNFQLLSADLNFKLEVDFGSGWEDWTANLFDVSIIQEPFTDTIAGILTRKIEVRLEELEPDIKWTKKNLPIRVYIYANSFEELLFDGLTKGGNSISENTTSIRAVDKTNRLLHTDFGSYATDNFRENDGQFLFEGENDEGGTVFDTNYRPKPPAFQTSQNIACYLKFNKNADNESGLYTCDQMLKAMGVFGGFNKDGVFKIKKRVWTTPTSQWDVRNLQRAETFRDLYLSEDYFFNSIDVLGQQFDGQSINIHLNIQQGKRSQEITNTEVSQSSTRSIFLENSVFENLYFGYLQTPDLLRTAYLNTQSLNDEAEGSTSLRDVYASPRAYNNVPLFNGTSRFGETATGFNFLDTTNFAIECWLRPEVTTANQTIITNRNASDRGQAVRIDPVNRRIQFVNHGIEAVSSNNNFFDWDESFSLLVSVNTATQQVRFFKNGNLVNTATYTSPLVASTEKLRVGVLGATATQYYRGRIQELRIYSNTRGTEPAKRWHNRALIDDGQTFNTTNDALKGYWRFNETSGATVNTGITGGQNITLNFTTRSTASLFNRLRAWESPNLSFLSTFSDDSFNQTVRFNLYNDTNVTAYLKRAYIMAPGVYQKVNDIIKNKNNITAGEQAENKKEFKSFYINDGDYAQDLADNLFSVYGNQELPVYEFEVEIQPRLMVGDIITFKVYAPNSTTQDCVGVILEKTSSITTSPFKAVDILKVKKLRNL